MLKIISKIVIAKSRVSLSLSSVTGSRGYTTRSHNAAARFRWTSRPNPRKTRLLSANWYRVLTQFRSGVGGPCRGGLSRVRVPPRGVLSLSLWHALLSTRALEIERGPSIPLFTYIYIYTFAKWLPTGHGSWRILRPTGVISLKDSRRCFLSHTYNGYESFNAGRLGLKREEIERILFREERCVNFKSICFAWHLK